MKAVRFCTAESGAAPVKDPWWVITLVSLLVTKFSKYNINSTRVTW